MTDFDSYFQGIYGERWPGLKNALLQEPEKTEFPVWESHQIYRLDEASIRAAHALQVQPHENILDLCAAPGGKTLVLFSDLKGQGKVTANELSFSRRKRLEEVIRTHAPETAKDVIQITGYDGNRFGLKRAGEFDRILLDAPCSSERHLLESDAEMKSWKVSRTQQLAPRQYSLLCSAILALKKGGTLVYSTCSISPLENDGVIERALHRKKDLVRLDPNVQDLNDLEKTQHGFQIFPDRFSGKGPMYIARLVRV